MIFINKDINVPKKFSTFSNALEEAYQDISNTAYWLLGEGLVNFNGAGGLDENNDFNLAFSYSQSLNKYITTFKYANTLKELKMSFSEDNQSKAYLASLKGNSFYYYAHIFDDLNPVAGGLESKVKLPLRNLVAESVPGYSNDYFSCVYVNGNPQKISSMSVDPDERNNVLNLGFSELYAGAIHPDPEDVNSNFNGIPINGASAKEWQTFFEKESTSSTFNMRLKFSNANIYKTPRYLIIEVNDLATQTIKYYNVPKNYSKNDGIFYTIDPTDEDVVIFSVEKSSSVYSVFSDSAKNTQNNVKIFFVNALESITPLSENFFSGISKKYQLPVKNLKTSEALAELTLLTYNTETNIVQNITLLNSNILGSLLSLNYQTGTLEILNILTAQLTATTVLLAYNIKYVPPIQIDYTGDTANNITLYGTHGSVFVINNVIDPITEILQLPNTLYVWAYLRAKPEKNVSVLNEKGFYVSSKQYDKLEIVFFITEQNEYTDILTTTDLTYGNTRPINIGYLNLNKPNQASNDPTTAFYNFKLNSQLLAPYARYKKLVDDLKIYLLDYKSYNITDNAIIARKDNKVVYSKKISYIPSNVELLELFGYIGSVDIKYTSTQGNVSVFSDAAQYVARFVIFDAEDPAIRLEAFNIVDPTSGSIYINKKFIQLTSKDLSENSIFAPKFLSRNFMASGTKYVVLEIELLNKNLSVVENNFKFEIDFELYLKYVPQISNYINTL